MNPRLVSIAGPLKGNSRVLTDDETAIGRDSSNQICLADISVSRRHCLIKKELENYRVLDLESLNGTFVNRLPVRERALEHGDQIEIGDSAFVFLIDKEDVLEVPTFEWTDDSPSLTTVELTREDALLWKPENLHLMKAEAARHLSTLLKVSQAVQSIRNLEELQKTLFALIGETIPADRGALVLTSRSLEDLTTVYSWTRDAAASVSVSRTVANQVLTKRTGILCNNILQDDTLQKAKSLIKSHTRSLICIPVEAYDRFLGLLYLDSTNPSIQFDMEHLQLLTGISAIAAIAVENTRHLAWLESENRRLKFENRIEHEMVGESRQMQEIFRFIERVSSTDTTVLICGESGTGKELIARAIHRNSPRASKPFVAVNCATLTEPLLESELFGHEKGAFTGAIAQKKGKFEVADQGTLFLDEVAELAPSLQAKLLRVLQEREIERVGGTRPIPINVRVIAATNKDLKEGVKTGSFRTDLLYRLNVVTLTVPPLREHPEDIPLLANYFSAKYSSKFHRKIRGFSPDVRSYLIQYNWPGNARELENAVEHAIVLGSTEIILPEDLPDSILEMETPYPVSSGKYHDVLKETKKQLILKAVEQARGNYTEAAKLLGVHANYLHRLIRNLNLKPLLKP